MGKIPGAHAGKYAQRHLGPHAVHLEQTAKQCALRLATEAIEHMGIITNGQIKANNTDEGARTTSRGEELVWEISPRTGSAPTALIDLAS